jgi:hypothetical protein
VIRIANSAEQPRSVTMRPYPDRRPPEAGIPTANPRSS